MSLIAEHARCPEPKIAEALRPFIRTRQEAETIRDGLQTNFPLTPIDLAQPLTASKKLTDPAPLTGVRKAYWKALQAHHEAQARYDALKAELSQPPTLPTSPEQDNSGLLVNNYIPLLGQREKYRRLEIIQRAYTRINAAGGATIGESFDSTAMLGIGELPTPPTSMLADRDLSLDVDEHVVKLKKAVLSAKQQIGEHHATITHAGDLSNIASNPHAELRALQSAHSELTLWMEDQLAMISDVDRPAEGNESATPAQEASKNEPITMNEIESLYLLYLDARNRLLDTIEMPPPTNLPSVPMAFADPTGSELNDSELRITPSEAILPYLEPLVSAKQQEQSLLQQSAYVRRQVTHAGEESRRVLARLSHESHLVQPGASHNTSWAEAAVRAGKSTVEFTMGRVKTGKSHADAAAQALDTIQSMPDSVDALTLSR